MSKGSSVVCSGSLGLFREDPRRGLGEESGRKAGSRMWLADLRSSEIEAF